MNLNATIIGQSIAFAFFVWFCMKYVWPPVVAILEERANKLAEGLHAADRAEHDLVLAK
jgi:F-type H+-transporting ATPase subunit b